MQRPDALSSAALDMYILRKLAAYIKKAKKFRTDLVGIADQFGMYIRTVKIFYLLYIAINKFYCYMDDEHVMYILYI